MHFHRSRVHKYRWGHRSGSTGNRATSVKWRRRDRSVQQVAGCRPFGVEARRRADAKLGPGVRGSALRAWTSEDDTRGEWSAADLRAGARGRAHVSTEADRLAARCSARRLPGASRRVDDSRRAARGAGRRRILGSRAGRSRDCRSCRSRPCTSRCRREGASCPTSPCGARRGHGRTAPPRRRRWWSTAMRAGACDCRSTSGGWTGWARRSIGPCATPWPATRSAATREQLLVIGAHGLGRHAGRRAWPTRSTTRWRR